MTSKSGDDLIHKNENVDAVDNHKKPNEKKSAIKNFRLDLNSITGIPNFTDLSKDPLKIPQHGLEIDKSASEPLSGKSATVDDQATASAQKQNNPDLFYKKESDKVPESDVEEIVAEVKKPKKNVVQSLEMSDFENEDH